MTEWRLPKSEDSNEWWRLETEQGLSRYGDLMVDLVAAVRACHVSGWGFTVTFHEEKEQAYI